MASSRTPWLVLGARAGPGSAAGGSSCSSMHAAGELLCFRLGSDDAPASHAMQVGGWVQGCRRAGAAVKQSTKHTALACKQATMQCGMAANPPAGKGQGVTDSMKPVQGCARHSSGADK